MAAEASRSSGGGGAADSYLGSLISLTSKSEIRYEGVLFNIDTDEASIGLRNVRSFGTEGRRKDGPQVPAIDKVYEYIVFRGSDIKDLQVKSSPPAPIAPSVHNDPAIIQSQYTPPSAPSSLPSGPATATQTGGSLSDLSTQLPQPGIPRPTYQNNTPLYQPGGNLASWNPSPPFTANNSSLSAPMYWPGYYAPSAPAQPQHPLLRPVQGLPMPPSLQPPFQQQQVVYPNINPSFPTGASNISALQSMEMPPPLLQPIASSTVSMPSTVLPVQSSLTVDASSTVPSKAPPQAVSVVSQSTNLSFGSSASSNMLDKSTVPTLVPNQTKPISSSPMPFNNLSETLSSSSPALVTPGQFLQPGSTVSTTTQMAQKDVEVVPVSSLGSPPQPSAVMPVTASSVPVSAETQAPLLPLPSPVNPKMNGVSSHTQYVNRGGRGRGRGRGNEFSRPVPNYTEDFDFEAMNEKFKKDEVWGHLGKSISKTDDGLDLEDEDDVDVPAADKKPVYNKDDFFDTLSCNALDRNGRTRFSEQMKHDTETFGEFPRSRGYRGGRGSGYGGRSRGGYQGRGYGYSGRGRGPNVYRAI
ncbi:hypothetical protein RND81_10G126500 [Saponaria officinalis]|uniref:Protein decapping 5 n=1 Tax=Saponaria officinalis TaxID=3572 RepID=A0AAW1I1C9_SAPOF